MQERINPSWETINNFEDKLTNGERALAKYLDQKLPEDWQIFVQPFLNGSRPDIVILNPKVGVMVYEVKDWKLSKFTMNDGFVNFQSENGLESLMNPATQVNHYKDKIIDQLVPTLRDEIEDNPSTYGIIKTGLYFHNAKGDEAREFMQEDKYIRIIGYDELIDDVSHVVPDVNKSSGSFINKEWANDLLFWLNPPNHSIEQTKPITLTKRQKEHAKPQPGHYRLKGVAGSGKTLVIAQRAAILASEGYKVLILTFNRTLWHYIYDMVRRSPLEFDRSRVTYSHFHGFCKDYLSHVGVPYPENFLDEIVPRVEKALDSRPTFLTDDFKYDAILIDEGQDYEWEWYNLISKFLKERDELLLVCDKKQNIYGKDNSWIDEKMKGFTGPWRKLDTVHRMPKKIGELANEFSQRFGLDQTVEVQNYQQLTLFERPADPHIIWKNTSIKDWIAQIDDVYNLIIQEQSKKEEGHPSDMVILVPENQMGIQLAEHFKSKEIEVSDTFGEHGKKSFWKGDGRLKLSTIHSYKGWEALHVIVLIPETWSRKENLDSLVYTSITRTMENLIVLNCYPSYRMFGHKYPSEWDEQ